MILNFRRGSAYANKKARNYLAKKDPGDIRKITVIRHAAIGDFMNIRPFLIELRSYFANAKITLSVLRSATYGMPDDLVDEIHIMDKDDPNNRLKKTGLLTRIKQARTLPPQDIIFDLTDSSLSALLLFFAKTDLKVGYPYRIFRRLFVDMGVFRSDFVVEAQSTLHMLNMLGMPKIKHLRYGFENRYKKNDTHTIVYFAGASTLGKRWEANKFATLIDKLSLKYPGYKHIILQGINADEKFLDIYEPLKSRENVVLQKAMDLDAAMEFLAGVRCLVSNDTGIRNMAIALQTPTIGVFFGTNPFRYWPNDDIHDCVFNNRYESPDVADVYEVTAKMVDKLYS